MNRQKIMANRRRDIIIIVGCTILALIGGYGWSRGFGNFTWFRNFDTPGTASVDDAVLNYEPLIQQYAKEYGIESYVPVIEALMQQESSGLGADVMQCSECYYNTEYDQTPGSIQDPEYSIKTGIHYFADCLNWPDVKALEIYADSGWRCRATTSDITILNGPSNVTAAIRKPMPRLSQT